MMYVTDDATMSGMKIAMAINKYRESFYPDYPSMHLDFRGSCADKCFPESKMVFTTMFGNTINLLKVKIWGEEWRWRLSQKRNNDASIHLRLYHKGEKFAFHFKRKDFNDLATIEQVIDQLARKENYVGLFPEVEPMEIVHRRVVNELSSLSNAQLLEEVNRRYKAEMPDWAEAINFPPSEPTSREELAALVA